jgi:hypothetical protein
VRIRRYLRAKVKAAKAHIRARPRHTSPRPKFPSLGQYGALVMLLLSEAQVLALIANAAPPAERNHVPAQDVEMLRACIAALLTRDDVIKARSKPPPVAPAAGPSHDAQPRSVAS